MGAGRPSMLPEQKKLQGTLRKDRENTEAATWDAITIGPTPEAWMLPRAKKLYKNCCAMLIEKGLLNTANVTQVAMMCQSFAKYEQAERKLKDEGGVTYTDKGFPMQSPWVAISAAAHKEYLGIASTFGFDPMSAMKIRMVGRPKADPFNDFFNEFNKSDE